MSTRIMALATAFLCASVLLGTAAPARADTVTCSGDTCDDGAWQAARGADNEVSFWGMSSGHNCTNYVAWRLISDGVQKPETNPGNASTWAERAITDGYRVDATPQVGAIAQWNAFAGGNGVDGHVAYVEQVNADGTILVSEDYWHEGDQAGPLTYRVVPVSGVSHFIHYLDNGDWLRSGALDAAGQWASTVSGLDPEMSAMSAVSIDGTSPLVFFAEGGELKRAAPTDAGWQVTSTGLKSESESMGAVEMAGGRPYVMSLENGELFMNVPSGTSWQRMATGVGVTGEVAAVNLGGLWPTVYLSQGGALYSIWGSISAALTPDGWPEVYSVESGMMFRSWLDADGWHKQSTGVTASGRTAAVSTPTGVQVMLLQDDAVFRISRNGDTWTKEATGLDGGTLITAVDLGGAAPVAIQVG